MRGRSASAVADSGLLAFDDGIRDGADFFGKPKPRLACRFVIGFTEHLHAIVTTERIDLAERFHVALGVNGKRAAAIVIEDAERRHIARAIGDIDHVFERHAAALAGD